MKFLHVINSMDPRTGGPCQGIRNLDKESQKLGITREVVSLNSPSDSFLGIDSFPIHALGPGKRPWHYSSKLIPWLIENINRFDVIIVNGIWLYQSYAVWKAIRQLKNSKGYTGKLPKVFVMPHGMLDPWFQGAKSRKLKALRNWIYWKLFESKVVNDAAGVLFTCQTELLLARKPFRPYQPKQEINVGYGIQEPPSVTDSMFKAFLEKCPTISNSTYLLFLSRIHYKKGIDLLLEAYAQLLQTETLTGKNIPDLVIAGPGLDRAYGLEILDTVKKNPMLINRVHFPGMLTGDAKWGAIYGCQAFILPSHQENFGIAVVEAMSCKKPVLISHQVNIWPEIEAGGGGVIAPDTLEGTRLLLDNWLKLSNEAKKKMGQQARNVFEGNFHIEKLSIRMSELLDQTSQH